MVNFNCIQSYQELISIFPEEALYYKFLGHCDINKAFCSIIPERLKAKGRIESTPSMKLRVYNNRILWNDFGLINQKGCYFMDLAYYLLEGNTMNYYQLLQKVYDIMLSSEIYIPIINKSTVEITKQIKYKLKLQSFQIEYYKSFGISIETLNKYNVVYATEFYYDNKLWHKSTESDFMNLFLFNAENNVWHINRPYANIEHGSINPLNKHRPYNMSDVIMGYSQLPKYSEFMGITKSYKDVMLNYECGIPSVCKYGERLIMPDYIINNLKKRCKHLIYFGDNDSTGIHVQQIYKQLYGLHTWSPPKEKDQSDFVKSYNGDKSELIKLYNNLKLEL